MPSSLPSALASKGLCKVWAGNGVHLFVGPRERERESLVGIESFAGVSYAHNNYCALGVSLGPVCVCQRFSEACFVP